MSTYHIYYLPFLYQSFLNTSPTFTSWRSIPVRTKHLFTSTISQWHVIADRPQMGIGKYIYTYQDTRGSHYSA